MSWNAWAAVLVTTAITVAANGPVGLGVSARAESSIVVIPESSVARPGDAGRRAHTNFRYLKHERVVSPLSEPFSGGFFETPASLACLYGLVARSPGCNPDKVSKVATGGSKVVAIVDAFDDPTAASDLQKYSSRFGLAPISSKNFQVVFAGGTRPSLDGNWQVEEAIDTQMVHALAPKAKIILVEAASDSTSDMLAAERVAARLVAAAGGGEISNSWGMDEFPSEMSAANTSPFTGTSAVFFAATGDSVSPSYPAVLPGVVAVGGTSIGRNPVTGDFVREVSWTEAGAGTSQYVSRPSYQAGVSGVVGSKRGVPDIALDANPTTGVWIWIAPSWFTIGGTSVAAPLAAAITNAAGHFAPTTATELTAIYANATRAPSDFHDITQGSCGLHSFLAATTGYDLCAGVGSPANLLGE